MPLLAGWLAAAAGRRQSTARAALTTELVESLDGSIELAVAGRGPERLARVRSLGADLSAISRRDALAGAASTTVGSLLSGLTIMAVLIVGIPAVHGGALSGVLLAAVVFLVLGAFEGITPLPAAARSLRACAQSAFRLEQLGDLPPDVSDPAHPRPAPVDPAAALELHEVTFGYSSGDPWPLHDASLTLTPGCRIALAGPSGSGKTTLAHLLVRFLDPVEGRVALGGIDLRELAQDDVRRWVLLCAQDAHVFTTTIRENLLLARRRAREDELWDALRAVQLDGWVAALPDGLDTMVGEDGELVSGGERQRITLARALVSDARYLILDEPTAQLDAETAQCVMRGIRAAAGDRGLLVISHRLEGLEGFTQFHLSDGKPVGGAPSAAQRLVRT